jgi:hypothetical protein
MRSAIWFSAAVLLCGISARAEWPRLNAKLVSGQLAIHKVVILPAQVSYQRFTFRGPEGSTQVEEQLAVDLYAAVSKELAARGVEVLPNPAATAKTDADRYAIADLQSRYDAVAAPMRAKLKQVERGQITLDDRVARFAPAAAADSLVFLRGHGQSGRFPMEGGFHMEAAFVDARTGEVLAFVWFESPFAMPYKSQDTIARGFRAALHDLPLPLPRPKS